MTVCDGCINQIGWQLPYYNQACDWFESTRI